MRVIFVGHACHLVEVDGLRVLTDPWLVDPIFGGHVERAPTAGYAVGDLPPFDVIALSHGHLDHFNAPTLAAIEDKSIPVIHPPVRFTELDSNLRRLGFTNLVARDDFEPFTQGGVRVVPTPSLGVLDECAWLVEGASGRFWNGVDAPQPVEVIREIHSLFGPPDLCAVSHNSFDQPSLLGLESFKSADHGPRGAAESAHTLEAHAAFPAASNLRWCGPRGPEVTRKVIRRNGKDLAAALTEAAPDVAFLDLEPGDAWSRQGGIERSVLSGTTAPRVANDYIHPFLGTGERHCGSNRPTSEEAFRIHLPARLRAVPDAARYLGQRVCIEVTGEDAATFTLDFSQPDAAPERGDVDAPYSLRLDHEDWKDLFERKISWQVLLVSDRLAVTRVEQGAPPAGLHFAYAMQAIFP